MAERIIMNEVKKFEWEEKKFTLVFVSHDERLANDFNRSVSLPELNRIKDLRK